MKDRQPAAPELLLSRTLALGLGFVILTIAACRAGSDTSATVVQTGDTSNASGQPLKEPYVVSSGINGILDVAMTVKLDTLSVPGLGRRTLRTYALTAVDKKPLAKPIVGFPGPTFRVRPGDSVRIALTNNLPKTADDPFVEIRPTETHQYAFRIPKDHPTGTFWYHPHKHGSVATQILNGMSGAFIVFGGPLDSMERALDIKEHLLAVQQVDSQVLLMTADTTNPAPTPSIVNRQLTPVVVMRPGEVQRWRIVNENVSTAATYGLVFSADTVRPVMVDIARDGIQYDNVNYHPTRADDSLSITPGSRLDVYVQAPKTVGIYGMKAVLRGRAPGARRRLQAGTGTGAGAGTGTGAAATAAALLTVQVVDAGTASYATKFPAALPRDATHPRLLKLTSDSVTHIWFSETNFAQKTGGLPSAAKPPLVYIGTSATKPRQFNPDSIFLTLPLNAVQKWEIVNTDTNIAHPFHIHVNPFQVMKVTYGPTDANALFYAAVNAAAANATTDTTKAPLWMDTFPLPVAWKDSTGKFKNGSIEIRQRYADFTGFTVLHCHILGHEERGMMQRILIAPEK